MKISVVIPIYNEIENVDLLHQRVTEEMQKLGEILSRTKLGLRYLRTLSLDINYVQEALAARL